MPDKRVVSSVEDMQRVAAGVAQGLRGGEVLLLYGELGAGKTAFVQGLAAALGVTEQITSPTFTIVGDYVVRNHPTIRHFVHVDLYRLEDTAAADPAIREVLAQVSQPDRVTAIEWADRLGETVPPEGRRVRFAYGAKADQRVVIVD